MQLVSLDVRVTTIGQVTLLKSFFCHLRIKTLPLWVSFLLNWNKRCSIFYFYAKEQHNKNWKLNVERERIIHKLVLSLFPWTGSLPDAKFESCVNTFPVNRYLDLQLVVHSLFLFTKEKIWSYWASKFKRRGGELNCVCYYFKHQKFFNSL